MKNKTLLFLLMWLTLGFTMYGQVSKRTQSFNPDKMIFGGDLGFGISTNYWSLSLSPQLGYKLTPRMHVGAGISYLHGESRGETYFDSKENSAGINLFAHYYPWKRIVLRVKPEMMHTWYSVKYYEEESGYRVQTAKASENKFVPAVVVGAGVHLYPVMMTLNYELVQNKYSSYSDHLFLGVGFVF